MSQKQVAKVTTQFLVEIRNALVVEGEAVLPGLGRIRVVECKGNTTNLTTGNGKRGVRTGKRRVVDPVHLRVFFKKAPALRDALKLGWRTR